MPQPAYRHHRLVRDAAGQKLSKSTERHRPCANCAAQGATPADIRRLVGLRISFRSSTEGCRKRLRDFAVPLACHAGRAGIRGIMAAKSRSRRTTRPAKKRPAKKRVSGAAAKARGKRKAAAAEPGMVEAALAAFAHEVRTPLTGILAISNLLATSDLDERERRWVDTIKAGAEHLASLATLFVDAARSGGPGLPGAAGFFRPAHAGAQRRRFAGRPRGGEGPAVVGRYFGKASGARGRRSRSPARGAGEPDRQCGEVHRPGQRRAAGDAAAQHQGQGRRRLRGLRQRDRPHARRDQAPVPAVLAGQCLHRLALRRRRARPVVGQATGARHGRRHRRRRSARAAAPPLRSLS